MNSHTLVMNVDYFDELSLHEHPMGPPEVERLVQQCAETGVNTIYWRAHGLGTAGYPSRLIASADWNAQTDFPLLRARHPDGSRPPAPKKKPKNARSNKLTESLKRMDPIATAGDACRRHGIQFFIWLDFLDEQHNRFLYEHPHCQVIGRDGKTVWPGLRAYSNPEALANQLAVVDELVAYKPDGLYLSTSCHSRHLLFPEPADFFGFEPGVADAYQRRTGRQLDPDDMDQEAWHQAKGDAYTEFFRQVKQRLKSIDGRLAIGTQFGPRTILTTPFFSTHVPFQFATQWQRWVDERIADILILGDYEWPWDRVPIWQAKGIQPPAGKQVADVLTEGYVKYAAGGVQCLLFSSWLSAYAQGHEGASAATLAGAMEMRTDTILQTGADGICLHEAHTFEAYNGFDTVTRMRHRLDGK